MAKKDIRVICPCCDAELIIDLLTQTVLRHRTKDSTPESAWGAATAKVAERAERGTDAFDSALSGERSRARDLDDLFDEAKKQAEARKKRDL